MEAGLIQRIGLFQRLILLRTSFCEKRLAEKQISRSFFVGGKEQIRKECFPQIGIYVLKNLSILIQRYVFVVLETFLILESVET